MRSSTPRPTPISTLAKPTRKAPACSTPNSRLYRPNVRNRASVRFIHISTDAVFDGAKDGIYTEDDTPNPPGVYAQTKLLGEQNVLSANPAAAVARVNFFGWSLSGTVPCPSFSTTNCQRDNRQRFTDVYFCPMFVGDLADRWSGCWRKAFRGCTTWSGRSAQRSMSSGQNRPPVRIR
jgi:dTDP-4-dehydrorhamnose reductase